MAEWLKICTMAYGKVYFNKWNSIIDKYLTICPYLTGYNKLGRCWFWRHIRDSWVCILCTTNKMILVINYSKMEQRDSIPLYCSIQLVLCHFFFTTFRFLIFSRFWGRHFFHICSVMVLLLRTGHKMHYRNCNVSLNKNWCTFKDFSTCPLRCMQNMTIWGNTALKYMNVKDMKINFS